MRTTARRRHYAAKFNTYDENVKYWEELSDPQKRQAEATFNWGDMSQFAYQVGGNGRIISRQRRLAGDVENVESDAASA